MEARNSKTKDLNYQTLKMQQYLELKTLTKREAIVLFKFRTRMAPFGENFRSGQVVKICPLCSSHVDSQEESFNCLTLKRFLSIEGNYKNIFSSNIPHELIKTLYKIYSYRKEYQEWIEDNFVKVSKWEAHVHCQVLFTCTCAAVILLYRRTLILTWIWKYIDRYSSACS